MARLVPVLILSLFSMLTPLSGQADDFESASFEQDRPVLESPEQENTTPIHSEISYILDQIENFGNQLETLNDESTISEQVALAGTSALMYIAFNAVRYGVLTHYLPDYQAMRLFGDNQNSHSAYRWIMAVVSFVLPETIAGIMTMRMAKYDPSRPELPFIDTLKVQAGATLAITVPGTLAQIFSKNSFPTVQSLLYRGNDSIYFRTLLMAGPIVVSGIYYTMMRMKREDRRAQLALQLNELRDHLLNLSAPTAQTSLLQQEPESLKPEPL